MPKPQPVFTGVAVALVTFFDEHGPVDSATTATPVNTGCGWGMKEPPDWGQGGAASVRGRARFTPVGRVRRPSLTVSDAEVTVLRAAPSAATRPMYQRYRVRQGAASGEDGGP